MKEPGRNACMQGCTVAERPGYLGKDVDLGKDTGIDCMVATRSGGYRKAREDGRNGQFTF